MQAGGFLKNAFYAIFRKPTHILPLTTHAYFALNVNKNGGYMQIQFNIAHKKPLMHFSCIGGFFDTVCDPRRLNWIFALTHGV